MAGKLVGPWDVDLVEMKAALTVELKVEQKVA